MERSVVLRSREPSRRRDERSTKNALEALLLAMSVQKGLEDKRRPPITGRKRVFSAPNRGLAASQHKRAAVCPVLKVS